MKWLPPAGSTQMTSDGKYCIVQANSQHWVAYEMHATTATELGVRETDLKARACCEAYDAQVTVRMRA